MATFVERLRLMGSLVIAWCAFATALPVHATSTDGYHKIIVVPVVVNSSTYKSKIFIHNPSTSQPISVQLTFYQGVPYTGVDPAPVVGVDCGVKAVAVRQALLFADLVALCPAAPPPPPGGSVFGWLRAEEVTPGTNRTFAIITRVDNTARTNGFEVEGFPAHTFTGADAYVVGMARTLDADGKLKTNCFVSALNEAATVTVTLLDGDSGAQLFQTAPINLPANRLVRLLDVHGVSGDYGNGMLKIGTTPAPGPGLVFPGVIAFCTVENDQSRDDDFRIAKAVPVFDNQASRTWIENVDELGNTFAVDNAHRNTHVVYFKHPDVVHCGVYDPATAGDPSPALLTTMEVRLRDPEGNAIAGGANQSSFANLYTGDKGEHGDPFAKGLDGKWLLDVQTRAGQPPGAYNYALICLTGSGFGGHEWVGRDIGRAPF